MHYCDNCHTLCNYENVPRSNRIADRAIDHISELEAELAYQVKRRCDETVILQQDVASSQADNARLRECLKRLEWCIHSGVRKYCPICRGLSPDTVQGYEIGIGGHKPDCWLAAAIAREGAR